MNKNFASFVVLVLAGCAADSQYHRADHFNSPIEGRMDAELRITQHQIVVSHFNSVAGAAAGSQAALSPSVAGSFAAGAGLGLIGALVDVAIDKHRDSVAEDAAKPMREHLANLVVEDLIYQSVELVDKRLLADSIVWQRIASSEEDDVKQHKLKEGRNILVFSPSYSVSYDGTTFTYVLSARIVDRAMNANGFVVSTPRYQQLFEYVLTKDNLPDGAEWATLSADQWKTILDNATSETVAMLNYDIATAPSNSREKMKLGRLPVSVDQTKGDRSWVHLNSGVMLSVSSNSLTASHRS